MTNKFDGKAPPFEDYDKRFVHWPARKTIENKKIEAGIAGPTFRDVPDSSAGGGAAPATTPTSAPEGEKKP